MSIAAKHIFETLKIPGVSSAEIESCLSQTYGFIMNGFRAYHFQNEAESFWIAFKGISAILADDAEDMRIQIDFHEFKKYSNCGVESYEFELFRKLANFEDIAKNSDGVVGYHANGHIASWEDLGVM